MCYSFVCFKLNIDTKPSKVNGEWGKLQTGVQIYP